MQHWSNYYICSLLSQRNKCFITDYSILW